MGDVIAQLKQGRPHMAWLTAGLHFADKHVRAVGYIDVGEDVDAVIGSGRRGKACLRGNDADEKDQHRHDRGSAAGMTWIPRVSYRSKAHLLKSLAVQQGRDMDVDTPKHE
jgi:hypothetical protein